MRFFWALNLPASRNDVTTPSVEPASPMRTKQPTNVSPMLYPFPASDSSSLHWAIYARTPHEVSDSPADNNTEQILRLRQVAEAEGLAVVCCLEESGTANAPGTRPQFNELLKKIDAGEVTGILCDRFDRLARNLPEAALLIRLLAEGKLQEIRTDEARSVRAAISQ
jgi:hypothetical protein